MTSHDFKVKKKRIKKKIKHKYTYNIHSYGLNKWKQ